MFLKPIVCSNTTVYGNRHGILTKVRFLSYPYPPGIDVTQFTSVFSMTSVISSPENKSF